MKKQLFSKNKSGAAAFYIVAISTLILTIIAVGFAAVIISEVTRSSNDDLSQSAFDSALAGVEDAKLAFYNYQNCLDQGTTSSSSLNNTTNSITCQDIVYWMEHSTGNAENNKQCDMVAHILGRIGKNESGDDNESGVSGVIVEESSTSGNNMAQAYTCTYIRTSLSDYRGTLSSENTSRVVKVKLDGVSADRIEKVKISWYANDGLTDLKFNNFHSSSNADERGVVFRSLSSVPAATPPTISVQLVQTAPTFSLEQFEQIGADATNRATLVLVPTDDADAAGASRADNYVGVYNEGNNQISADQVVKSNDKTVKNLPYAVYCNPDAGTEFVCSTYVVLPRPIGDTRSDDTFMFVVSVPYGQPDTDFALEFYCGGESCGTAVANQEEDEVLPPTQARLKGVQIAIDSTGRANDLFRRVETRMDSTDANFPYPLYALQLLGDGNDSLLRKDLTSTIEYGL